MTTLARRNSSIHKIREYTLPKVNLEEEYEVIHAMQEGWRGRLLLVEHKRTRHEVVLKAVHKESTSKLEFFREFHYNYYLSPHINILNAYDVAFQAGDYYIFAQEYAPFGDLTSNLSETGLGEANVKKIAPQIVSALEFMHSKDLVHRNINMDNILVFNIDFSEVKLCDFGATRKSKSLLKRKTISLPYAAPEVVDTVQNECFYVSTKQDVWQLGVLLYILLTGALPWQKADVTDPRYLEYINWKKRKTLKTPKRFSNFTTRALKMFKRLLEPKQDKRANVREVYKYLEDKWLVRPMKRQDSEIDNQSVCYSTFSVHSSKAEKDKVLHALKAHGIETTVDRIAKRKRIHEWIEKSLTNNYMFDESEGENNNDNIDIIQHYPTVKENVRSDFYFTNFDTNKDKKYPDVSLSNDVKTYDAVKTHEMNLVDQNGERNRLIISARTERYTSIQKENDEKHSVNSSNVYTKNLPANNRQMTLMYPNAAKSTASIQESSQQHPVPADNRNSYSEMNSSKSQYHRSPNRNQSSLQTPPKSQSSTLKINRISDSQLSPAFNNFLIQNQDRSRTNQRYQYSDKSISNQTNSNSLNQRSRSLTKKMPNTGIDIQKSKTHSYVNATNASVTQHESDDSTSYSDDSLTSVIPVAYYH